MVYISIFNELILPINSILIFVAEYVIATEIIDYIVDNNVRIPIIEITEYIN